MSSFSFVKATFKVVCVSEYCANYIDQNKYIKSNKNCRTYWDINRKL